MSFQPVKTALKYVSAWSLVAGFAALLTIIFNFLGTLFCAALGGMMMGATKASWKLSLPFSVLCPGVLLAVMRAQRTEIPNRQIAILLIICLAAFWAIYLVAAALMAEEQKGAAATNGKASSALNGELRAAVTTPEIGVINETVARNGAAEAVVAGREALVEHFDGHWCCEECDNQQRAPKRVLDIKKGALLLSTLDAGGQICACTRARLEGIESVGAADEAEFASPAI